jgi:hypothetical protein
MPICPFGIVPREFLDGRARGAVHRYSPDPAFRVYAVGTSGNSSGIIEPPSHNERIIREFTWVGDAPRVAHVTR